VSSQSLQHLAIIPDGNRRWSDRHRISLERTYLDSCTKMIDVCRLLETLPGLLEVSLFFLSLENLHSRPRSELDPLFSAGHHFLDLFYESALGEAIDLRWVGMHESEAEIDSTLHAGFVERIGQLPRPRQGERTVNVLMGYDVRKDIDEALRRSTTFSYENLAVNRRVDLIVRSGGHQRLSGFLPLMCQYAEFEFIEALFPDVTLQDIADSIGRFSARTRKFGA
jgi:undecaprenyl pyrophosphate synthase